ncbi:MAG: ArsR family transcriptional regulator [Methanocellales archaeon]|nr:ArsR family transcriptional regulator [Methanocellales archaeon]
MLDKLLKPSSKKIIESLLKKEKSLSELASELNISKPALLKHLRNLKDIEVISEKEKKTHVGREIYYSLNQLSLVLLIDPKKAGIIGLKSKSSLDPRFLLLEQVEQEEFKSDLRKYLEKLEDMKQKPEFHVVLFGSVARGEGTWKSDIDLLFLRAQWKEDIKKKILDALSEAGMDTKHRVKPQFMRIDELKSDLLLPKEVKDSGLVIYGDLNKRLDIWKQMKRYKNITI